MTENQYPLNREMGPLRFELRFRRPERRRMDQATLRSLTGMVKAHQQVRRGLRSFCDSSSV